MWTRNLETNCYITPNSVVKLDGTGRAWFDVDLDSASGLVPLLRFRSLKTSNRNANLHIEQSGLNLHFLKKCMSDNCMFLPPRCFDRESGGNHRRYLVVVTCLACTKRAGTTTNGLFPRPYPITIWFRRMTTLSMSILLQPFKEIPDVPVDSSGFHKFGASHMWRLDTPTPCCTTH